MRNSRQPLRRKRIVSSEYAQSDERLERLQDSIIEGEEAEIVLKYAERFLEQAGKQVLDSIASDKDVDFSINYYKAAVEFESMIRSTVSLGLQKASTFKKVVEERQRRKLNG